MSDAPQRAVRLKLDLQADTRDSLIRALENITRLIERQEMSTGCSGGWDSGYTYEYREAPGPTHDEYVAQLHQWLAEKRSAEQHSGDAPGVES